VNIKRVAAVKKLATSDGCEAHRMVPKASASAGCDKVDIKSTTYTRDCVCELKKVTCKHHNKLLWVIVLLHPKHDFGIYTCAMSVQSSGKKHLAAYCHRAWIAQIAPVTPPYSVVHHRPALGVCKATVAQQLYTVATTDGSNQAALWHSWSLGHQRHEDKASIRLIVVRLCYSRHTIDMLQV
jgi:hypothetical protein